MSEFTDKVSGLAHQAAGKIKEAVGDLTGNDETKFEGEAEVAEGNVREGVGNVKGGVKNVIDDL